MSKILGITHGSECPMNPPKVVIWTSRRERRHVSCTKMITRSKKVAISRNQKRMLLLAFSVFAGAAVSVCGIILVVTCSAILFCKKKYWRTLSGSSLFLKPKEWPDQSLFFSSSSSSKSPGYFFFNLLLFWGRIRLRMSVLEQPRRWYGS